MKMILLNSSKYDFTVKETGQVLAGGRLTVTDEFTLMGESNTYGHKINQLKVTLERFNQLHLDKLSYPSYADVKYSPLANNKSIGELISLDDITPIKLTPAK